MKTAQQIQKNQVEISKLIAETARIKEQNQLIVAIAASCFTVALTALITALLTWV